MSDDATEASRRNLDDCSGAVAVRAFDSGTEVLPGRLVADPHTRSPALGPVQSQYRAPHIVAGQNRFFGTQNERRGPAVDSQPAALITGLPD
jgi:hypothetical protein